MRRVVQAPRLQNSGSQGSQLIKALTRQCQKGLVAIRRLSSEQLATGARTAASQSCATPAAPRPLEGLVPLVKLSDGRLPQMGAQHEHGVCQSLVAQVQAAHVVGGAEVLTRCFPDTVPGRCKKALARGASSTLAAPTNMYGYVECTRGPSAEGVGIDMVSKIGSDKSVGLVNVVSDGR